MCCRTNCSFTNRPDVLKTINGLLEKRHSAKTIEKLTGIGHSIVGRHHQHCFVKVQAEKIRLERQRQKQPALTRVLVKWADSFGPDAHPAGTITLHGRIISPNEVRPDDVLLIVTYDERSHIGNPSALAPNGWNERAQNSFQKRVPAQDKKYFIDSEHERALAENAKRIAAEEKSPETVLLQVVGQK
jgi:hypothetical protein